MHSVGLNHHAKFRGALHPSRFRFLRLFLVVAGEIEQVGEVDNGRSLQLCVQLLLLRAITLSADPGQLERQVCSVERICTETNHA